MKTPPDRSGITFEVGALLEARDRHKNWYSSTIEKIDYDKERVLIHYKQWSRRHNEWFHWNSPYLRPLERVSLRRQGLNPQDSQPMFVSGSKVLACWTDCRFYPAKILRVNNDDSYTVRFYDGVVRTVKPTKIKPFQPKARSEKTAVGSEGWEEGESEEEERGAEREDDVEAEEAQKEVKVEPHEISEENKQTEEERKRRADSSSSFPPAKKKRDDGKVIGAQDEPNTSDSALSSPPNPSHTEKDVLLERQAHLPTTHKFSREPLYRVIKNQPPPILSIELDHNPFKCPSAGCCKSFRKASLLHYHIKYYHSQAEQAGGAGEQEAARKRRCSSEGGDLAYDQRTANPNNSFHRDDKEPSIMGTVLKKEKAFGDRKDKKNSQRTKLKKKKKKKKKKTQTGICSSDDENTDRPPITLKLSTGTHNIHPPVDDGSDWSTLTAESGEDAPFWSVNMEAEECELVRCVCEVDEENDFMIQCESCLCWQHGTCMGLYEDNVPHNYICYCCRQTAGWRRAQRLRSEPDWLVSGHMFGLSCVKENYWEKNWSKISLTGSLLGHTHTLKEVLKGLQLKISLLHSPTHQDLQLWRLPWRQDEGRGLRGACYVNSEHSYQKQGASWEKTEEPEDATQKPASTSDNDPSVKQETHTDGVCSTTHTQTDTDVDDTQATHTQVHTSVVDDCRLNLLEHVETLQRDISSRMELMEKDLDVLESWLDHSGELEPPDPLSRLPQLKQRIRRLLSELCVIRRLSLTH